MDSILSTLDMHSRKVGKLEVDVSECALETDFKSLLDRFNVFQELESIGALENVFMPRVYKFCAEIDRFEESNMQMRDCIKKFEGEILQKYSKSSMKHFQLDLPNKFLTVEKMSEIDQKINYVKDLVLNENSLAQRINSFKAEFEKLIFDQIES